MSEDAVERSAGAVLVRSVGGAREGLVIRVRAAAWEIPKGHVEEGETPEAAALRELAEETAFAGDARIDALLGAVAYDLPSGGRKEVVYFRAVCAAAPAFGPRPKRTRELRFVSADEIDALPLVAEALRPILRRALQRSEAAGHS